jgi:ABC-2 type transport system permease protein
MNNIGIVIQREYSFRVKKKAFVLTTLIMPIVFLALMFAPTLIAQLQSTVPSSVTLVDQSGQLAGAMLTKGQLPYQLTTMSLDSVMADADNQTILVLGADAVANPTDVRLLTRSSSNVEFESLLRDDVKAAIESVRLREYNINDLDQILAEVEADVAISTQTIGDDGKIETSDSFSGLFVGMALSFVLYMLIVIYGQIVMQSIIEEKSNRVLELIVTSVKPTQLMIGKIVGIGAVALTQVLIWAALIMGFIEFVLPLIADPQLLADVDAFRSGTLDMSQTRFDPSIISSLAMIGSMSYVFPLFGYLALFLLGGFILYASIYAAIGAAVDNIQDGAQLQMFALVPIIVALMFSMSVGLNPNSDAAVVLSIIPFTSPMVMLARIPLGVPVGEIIISALVLLATALVLIWIAAKIYRVGIFMYGKKPTVKDLIRWARYK